MESELEEQEANIFAAYLLMPEGMFEKDLRRLAIEDFDNCISKLSKLYQVPQAAVAYRISLMEKRKI